MRNTTGILLATVFAGLSLLHIYWALGGKFGSGVTVPTVDGARTFNPSPLGTALVGGGLLMAMLTILGYLGLLGAAIPGWVFRWATCSIALIFLARAIGEFRLVGFFKRSSDTLFAYWDTWLFSPLCLLVGVLTFLLIYTET